MNYNREDCLKRLKDIFVEYHNRFNMTYTAIAEDMGIGIDTVYRIAHSKTSGIRMDVLAITCEYFGVSADYILFGKE